jgi:hypothetical protein
MQMYLDAQKVARSDVKNYTHQRNVFTYLDLSIYISNVT